MVVFYQKKWLVLLLAVLALLTTSCSRKGNAGQERQAASELRYGFSSEPATLNPLDPGNTADGRRILFNVFEGLLKPDTEGRLQPCIAESGTVEQGGAVYNFKLRNNVFFHDGSPVTPADVKFSLETAKTAGFDGFIKIERIETGEDNTVRVILESPDPEFLPYIAIGIVKADAMIAEKKAVGSGPYYIESYNVQQSLVLKKFDKYWRGDTGAHLDKITIMFFSDSDMLALSLRGGGIGGASLTSALAQQLDQSRFDFVPSNSASVQLLALNNKVKPLDDIRVRQALNYGIDIQEIIDTAFYGTGKPSGSPLIPGLSEYYDTSLENPYPLDTGRAIALLDQAGYGGGVPGGSGEKLSLIITVPANFVMHVDTAQVVVSQLRKIGINASIQLVDWATWLRDVYQGRNYQATIISLDSPNVSPRSFLSRYCSDSSTNFINFSNADFDRVYDATLAELDETRRVFLYKEAQRLISNNAASVYIQDITEFKVFRKGEFGGALNYPLFVTDFASMYRK